jgi:hypothetical protein
MNVRRHVAIEGILTGRVSCTHFAGKAPRSAHHSGGIQRDRISIFETYKDATEAVLNGKVDAYASVARAHAGFLTLTPDLQLEVIIIPSEEKSAAFGAFAFGRDDQNLRQSVDDALSTILGSQERPYVSPATTCPLPFRFVAVHSAVR